MNFLYSFLYFLLLGDVNLFFKWCMLRTASSLLLGTPLKLFFNGRGSSWWPSVYACLCDVQEPPQSSLVESLLIASRVKHWLFIGGVNLLCLLFQDKTYVVCFGRVLERCNPVARYHAVLVHWPRFWKAGWSGRSVRTVYGSSLLPALIIFGQLDPISIPTSRFSSSGGISSHIVFFWSCHLSATAGVGITLWQGSCLWSLCA